jgi:signal transduction histidine kinase/ActR/RegA family two-component response regulator
MKLRTHLFLLTLATVVPIVLFAAGLIVYHARLERASVERGMRDTARALTLALDRDLSDIKTGVETLAASVHLDDPADLRSFYDEAATVSRSFGGWAVLSEPSGQQALNTSRRFGDVLPMPSAQSLAMMRSVAESRQTFVSNVFVGTASRRPAVIIAVPVIRDGRVRYVLDFPFEPRQFTRLLQEAALSPGWIATILDRDGGTVGRVPDPEAFVGRRASPVWVERTTGADEGFFRGSLLSGPEVYAAYKRSKESGWVVGVAAPVELVGASARRALLVLSGGGVVLLAVASAVAVVLGKRIADPIVALADSLKTQTPRPPRRRATVREIEELRHALDEAMARRRQLETEQLARAAAEQRAEREQSENRAKDDFLAVLSHELRTPLNSMLGWVRLLKGGGLDPGRAAHGLDVIERNVGQQARLISDLLDVSRIVVGRLELAMQIVDLPRLAAGVAETVRPAAEAEEITLTSRLDADAGPVRGDPERLRQVIENLLGNAIKFTPRGGAIILQLERDGGEARLSVTDNGKGISADFLPHIFERFRQADNTSTRAHAGLGLGLAIVRHLVELHGGRASAESAGEGRGATFTVTLPIVPVGGRSAEGGRAGSASTSYPLAGVTVLVVDDDGDTRNLLATVLAQHGAVPTTATDARDGMTTLRRLTPDVLVCDIAMPGDDGYAFVGQLRAWEATTGDRVPALALTAYARPEDRDRALAAGFDLHLAKPVEPADFLAAVARLAGRNDRLPGPFM